MLYLTEYLIVQLLIDKAHLPHLRTLRIPLRNLRNLRITLRITLRNLRNLRIPLRNLRNLRIPLRNLRNRGYLCVICEIADTSA